MSAIKVTKQEIQQIAEDLVSKGIIPTQKLIRQQLGKGSCSTIQKHLLDWKKLCFKKHVQSEVMNDRVTSLPSDWKEEKRSLENAFNKQIAKNEHYTQELIKAEKENVALKNEKYQLQTANQELQLRLTAAEAVNKAVGQVTQKITNRLDANGNKNANDQQQVINGLREELKTLNETSLIALRDASTKSHEALMQEKVNSINLQTKVDSLYKELIDLKKQLSDTVLKHQIQTQTLLRQINEQQKIIQDHIGFEKLRELIGEQELMLHFNNKLGASYGK